MLSLSAILPAVAFTRYDDDGAPHYTVGERVLMVLRRSEWVTKYEIDQALGVEDRDDSISVALSHYVRIGKVHVRTVARTRVYRINESAFRGPRPLRGRAAALKARSLNR